MSTVPKSVVACAAAVGGCACLAGRLPKRYVVGLLSAAVATSWGLDGQHFVRIALGDLSRFLFRRRRPVLEADRVSYRVWPSDVDRNAHMNNAKFLRVANYARRTFWASCGVWRAAFARKANLIVTATSVRYRRELRLFAKYDVVSQLKYWDDACFYTEHRFEKDQFVHAVMYCKYRVVGATPSELLRAVSCDTTRPDLPPDLDAFLAYDRLSSAALRPPSTVTK